MMAPGTCPPLTVLEAFAAGSCADGAVGAHVGACAVCRAAVEEARENNEFIAYVRTALAAQAETDSAKQDAPAPVETDLVSGYQIQEEIHRGGQGVIYRAVQTRTRRTVAIKMLLGGHGATGRQKERFEREIRIAAGLRHPNIVTVHDNGYISGGRYGLVMEYVEGVPLDRWSRSLDGVRGRDARRKALRQRLGVMVKVCDAVLCAHQQSIVHRDLKPANILVDGAGEPHILDFGIARDTGPAERTRLTHTGEFAGTLAYASPEQVSGDFSKVDTRTDIYSLGVIMYELVSGKMPYAVDGQMSRTIRSIESAEPAPLPRRTRDPDGPWVDGEVSTIILKAMAKDPGRRYQTAAGLRNDISRYLVGEAIEARRDSTWYVLRKTAARHRVVFAAAGLIIVLLAAFGAVMALQARRLEVRGRELASALSDSNVERGRSLAAAGNIPLAEAAVWPELIRAGVTRIDGPEAGFSGTPEARHAYWALWDVFRRASCIATLRTHGNALKLLYFEEGGRRLCALDTNGNLNTWSAETWQALRDRNLVAPIDGVAFGAALAPSGSIAIFTGGGLRVIDPGTGDTDDQAVYPNIRPVNGEFSPDGTLLATIFRDSRLRLKDARSLETKLTITEPVSPCRPAFSHDGRLIATAGFDGSIGLWNTTSGALERTVRPPEMLDYYASNGYPTARIVIGPDGTIAALLGPRLVVWPADGSAPLKLGASQMLHMTLAFLPGSEGRMLVSSGSGPGGGSGVTIVWKLPLGEPSARFVHAKSTTAFGASPDGRLIAVGDSFGTVRVYATSQEPHVSVLHSEGWAGSVPAVSRDGKFVALTAVPSGQTGRDLLLMDLKDRTTISRSHRDGAPTCALEFAADGKSLFEGDTSGRIMQWDLPAGTLGREFVTPDPAGPEATEHRRPVKPNLGMDWNQLRLSPDGSMLAQTRDDNGLVGLWDVPSGRWIGCLDTGANEFTVIEFSPDGRTLATRQSDTCALWDVQARKIKRSFPLGGRGGTVPLRFSADGMVIASGVRGCIRFFDADTGRVLSENRNPESSGLGMAFHPGGNVFCSSATEHTIGLWDTRTGRELLSLQKHTAFVNSLVFTPDGNTLISSDSTGTVLAWDLTYYNDHIRRELEYRASHSSEP